MTKSIERCIFSHNWHEFMYKKVINRTTLCPEIHNYVLLVIKVVAVKHAYRVKNKFQ